MNFLGFIKNGNKGTYGLNMPAFYPASRVSYDNTNHPELPNMEQGATDALASFFGTGSGRANRMAYREEITSITQDMWDSISNGDFLKVHVGMHYTAPSGRKYWFADADYFFGTGDTEQTSHHMVVVEDEISHTAQQQTTDTTTGGAAGSLIYSTTLPSIQSELETDFGASHIKTQSIMMCNAVSGSPSGWTWVSKAAHLLNARMVYGNPLCYSGNTGEMFNGGNRSRQLSLFRAMPETIIARNASDQTRANWWLDDVESSLNFGGVLNYGRPSTPGASGVWGIRRSFLIG